MSDTFNPPIPSTTLSTTCQNCHHDLLWPSFNKLQQLSCQEEKTVPECGQCWRAGQKCPGYRDPSTLIFRDESTQVINRARSKVSKKTSAANPTDHAGKRTTPPQAPIQQQNTVPDCHASCPSDAAGETMLAMRDVDVGAEMFAGNFMPELMSSHDPFNLDEAGLFSLHQAATPSILPVSCDGGDDVALDQFPDDGGDGERLRHNNFSRSQSEVIAPPFSLPLVILGLDFFLSHYVVRQSGPSSGFFDYVPAMLAQDDGGNDMLEGAILALSFSGLARTTSQAGLLTRSMMMYTRSMERVNLALADPQTARHDSTIVSVLVLALYEFSKASIDGWKHHIEGAISLLNLRGRSQFSTSAGLQIFKDVFSQLLTNCLRSGSPMPSSLRMLRIEAANAISVSDPYWVACSGMVELLDLYQHISPGGYSFFPNSSGASSAPADPSDSSNSPSTASGSSPAFPSSVPPGSLRGANRSIEHLERYLSQALEIDYRLESTFSKCPPEWQFTATSNLPSSSNDPMCIQRDVNHIYYDVWIASVWNSMRICRILANHAISHLLLRGANTDSNWFFANNYADRLHQATQTIVRLRDEMLASVPQLMGCATSPAQEQQLQQQQQDERSQNNPGLTVGCYFACWALFTVGCMHNLSHETRVWTVAQLRRISSQTGLAQADDFANFVQSSNLRPPLSGW
ncbi:hypothetical protein N7470_010149 [Penicillium chermesinum]|nr:hypothetical protein N7470_010149 [Penicillium chermesinum]